MARLTKWQIACMIEALPGNTPWGFNSMCTLHYDYCTRSELVERYNSIIDKRGLNLQKIS